MPLESPRRDIGRPLDAPLQAFDLPPLLERLRRERTWKDHERNSMTLHKSPGLRVVLVAMHAGTVIPEHTAAYPFTLLAVEGRLRFAAGKKTIALQRGELLTVHAGIPHALEAPEEAAFLLTLAAGAGHPAER